MAAGTHMVEFGEARDAAQMRDAAGMHHGRADIVDQLLLDQLLAVPDRIEHFADGQRRRGVLADQAEAGLVFRRHRILHPEQAIGFEILAQPPGLDRGQAVVHVVQQVHVPAQRLARRFEQRRHASADISPSTTRFSVGSSASAGS